MTTHDDYFKHGDKPFAENINDGLLVSNAFDYDVSIELPTQFTSGDFPLTNAETKCDVSQIQFKNPSDVTIDNTSHTISSNGSKTFKMGFYPNFQKFGGITKVEWELSSGTMTVDIYDENGNQLASNINNGVLDNQNPGLRTLQMFEFRLNMNNAVLTKFKIHMVSKTKTSNITIGIPGVTGLEEALASKASTIHTHGNVSNDGKIGNIANKPIITGSNGVLTTGTFGNSANTFCQGNDSRLSDARTPTAHTHGAITNTGTIQDDITNVNRVLVTDSNNQIKTIEELPVDNITTPDISSKQDKSNIVTSWGSTPSDTKYPSEKLTKDTLDGKAASTHTHSWDNITSKPSTFTPSSHTHTKSQITDFPSTMTPSSHSHGNITNEGAIGSTSGKPIITTTSGKLTTGSFGTTSGTFCQGNDSRLSDARTPTSHATSATTYGVGTSSNYGHLKLDSSITSGGANPVTGGAIYTALSGKSSTSHSHSLSSLSSLNHATSSTTYGVGSSSNYGHVKVDDSLSSSSTNPVQNKVINTALSGKASSSHTHGRTYIDITSSSSNPRVYLVANTDVGGFSYQFHVNNVTLGVNSTTLLSAPSGISDSYKPLNQIIQPLWAKDCFIQLNTDLSVVAVNFSGSSVTISAISNTFTYFR